MNEKLFPQNRIIIASHNAGKVHEIQELLSSFHFLISSSSDHGVLEPEETETTFEGNALLKARATCDQTQCAALADDSGLVIPYLDGAPGIFSARWAGENRNFILAIEKVKEKLGSELNVKAYFHCTLALICPDGTEKTFTGICQGSLQFPPKGTLGFGYDPIFIAEGQTQTFGEMTPPEKKKLSHRTKAFNQFIQYLESF